MFIDGGTLANVHNHRRTRENRAQIHAAYPARLGERNADHCSFRFASLGTMPLHPVRFSARNSGPPSEGVPICGGRYIGPGQQLNRISAPQVVGPNVPIGRSGSAPGTAQELLVSANDAVMMPLATSRSSKSIGSPTD